MTINTDFGRTATIQGLRVKVKVEVTGCTGYHKIFTYIPSMNLRISSEGTAKRVDDRNADLLKISEKAWQVADKNFSEKGTFDIHNKEERTRLRLQQTIIDKEVEVPLAVATKINEYLKEKEELAIEPIDESINELIKNLCRF